MPRCRQVAAEGASSGTPTGSRADGGGGGVCCTACHAVHTRWRGWPAPRGGRALQRRLSIYLGPDGLPAGESRSLALCLPVCLVAGVSQWKLSRIGARRWRVTTTWSPRRPSPGPAGCLGVASAPRLDVYTPPPGPPSGPSCTWPPLTTSSVLPLQIHCVQLAQAHTSSVTADGEGAAPVPAPAVDLRHASF